MVEKFSEVFPKKGGLDAMIESPADQLRTDLESLLTSFQPGSSKGTSARHSCIQVILEEKQSVCNMRFCLFSGCKQHIIGICADNFPWLRVEHACKECGNIKVQGAQRCEQSIMHTSHDHILCRKNELHEPRRTFFAGEDLAL